MINFRAKRVGEKDLLAFANELMNELGGNGKDGRAFGIDKNGDVWLFGKKLQTAKEETQPEQQQEA